MAFYLHLCNMDATIYIYNNNGTRIYLGMVIVVISKRRALTMQKKKKKKGSLKELTFFKWILFSIFLYLQETGGMEYMFLTPHSTLNNQYNS